MSKINIVNRVTNILGIKYPIVQGGMQWVGRAELAAAVSNAGGLGIITALTQPTPEDLRNEIRKCRSMLKEGSKFGVNITILPAIVPPPYEEYAKVILEEKVNIIETAGNNPQRFVNLFKSQVKSGESPDIIIIHKCTSIRHALKAQKLGVDIVSVDGFECAGHPGEDDVPNMVLLAKAGQVLSIPFLASGGFADGRGLVAAFALGAEGINMGTRFMCTVESPIHEKVKQAIVKASERDTELMFRSLRNTARVFKNDVSKEVAEIERKSIKDGKYDTNFSDIQHLVSGKRGRVVFENGDINHGVWTAGTVMGIINDIPTCEELINNIVREADKVVNTRLPSFVKAKL